MAGGGIAPFKARNMENGILQGTAQEDPCGTHSDWETFHLGDVTVFQAEMYAVYQTAEYIIHNAQVLQIYNTKVAIYSDSQSVVKTLCHYEAKTELMRKTINSLNKACALTNSSIVIRWCKAHVDHRGNEWADKNAKIGAADVQLLVPDPPKITYEQIKANIKARTYEQWDMRWQHHCPKEARCRQTKAFLPKLNRRFSNEAIMSDRTLLSKLILIITGHNFFNYHRNIIDNNLCQLGIISEDEVQSAKCDFCHIRGQRESDRPVQTSIHIFGECEAFATTRHSVLEDAFPDLPFNFSKHQITQFLWATRLEILPMLQIEREEQLREIKHQRKLKKNLKKPKSRQ